MHIVGFIKTAIEGAVRIFIAEFPLITGSKLSTQSSGKIVYSTLGLYKICYNKHYKQCVYDQVQVHVEWELGLAQMSWIDSILIQS